MLSKFYCDSSGKMNKADTFEVSALNSAIKEIYSCKDVHVERIFPGGTLGIFFQAVMDGKRFFIKTCDADKMCQANLHKEVEIMKALYERQLCINSFVIDHHGLQKEFIIMDYIVVKNNAYEMKFVQELIRSYHVKLNGVPHDIVNYNTDDLYRAASISFEILSKTDLLSVEVGVWCERVFKRLETYNDNGRVLCHGDLSNVNIMIREEDVLVLDWEDAVMAYPEYDILYWLTFYSQRKYYSSHLFDDIGLEEQYGKDIMVMILLIKCYLSYRNKSYLNNKLSINDRINEIICM